MYTVSVCRQGEPLFVLDFDKPEITIGRGRDNDIVLPHGTVSRRHARVMVRNGAFFVVDDGSSNGTYVVGQRINTVHALEDNQTVYCGIFSIDIRPVSQVQSPRHFADPMHPSPVSYTDRTNPRAEYPRRVDHAAKTYGPGELNVSDLQAAMAARGQRPQPPQRPAQPPRRPAQPPREPSRRSEPPGYSEPNHRSEPSYRAERPQSAERSYGSEPNYRAEPRHRSEPSYRPEPARPSEPARHSEPNPRAERSWAPEAAPAEEPSRRARRSRDERPPRSSEPPREAERREPEPNLDPEPMPVNAVAKTPTPLPTSYGGIPAPHFEGASGPSVMRGPSDN